ncbi:MAG: hypothetical protein ABIN74_10830 [Ferruginibacter sp.]
MNTPPVLPKVIRPLKVMTDKLGDVYVLTSNSFYTTGGNKVYRSKGALHLPELTPTWLHSFPTTAKISIMIY